MFGPKGERFGIYQEAFAFITPNAKQADEVKPKCAAQACGVTRDRCRPCPRPWSS